MKHWKISAVSSHGNSVWIILFAPFLPVESHQCSEAVLLDLVSKAKQGDAQAYGKIYDHFFDSVYRYAAFRLPPDVAEDVVADAFVKVWEKLHTFKPRRRVPFGAWLFRIVRHCVIDAYRKHRQWEQVPEDVPDGDMLNSAEARVKRQHLLSTVRGAMHKLPARYREVLQLSYMAELPHSEVARVMRTSEGSVRTLKFRALRKLEEHLPPDTHDV